MARFVTKMPRPTRGLRLEVTPFPPQQMKIIADNVLAKIRQRLSMGLDIYDQAAPELSAGYKKFKTKRMGRPGIRDWRLTGITLGHLKVKSARNNQAVMGFLPGIRRYSLKSKLGEKTRSIQDRSVPIALVVRKNQQRRRQWGVSPSDNAVLINAIRGVDFIQAAKTG